MSSLKSWLFKKRKQENALVQVMNAQADKPLTIEFALRDHFAPVLRRHGFKGSGRNFHRVTGDVFQAVYVQGSRWGGMFAVNLGVHPLAIPDFFGNPIDVKKFKEINCDFRRRLSESDCDRWWSFGASAGSMIEAATSAAAVFESIGVPMFDAQADPLGPLFTMTPQQFEIEGARPLAGFGFTKPRMALSFARLRKAQGKLEECRAFARIGLQPKEPRLEVAADERATIFQPSGSWIGEAELIALSRLEL